jgi:ABC-2 type transport system permease protein
MSAFTAHLGMSLRLHFRNRMALLYGYLFPVIFLIAFYVLYRHERVPLLRHMGELLTVAVLGGACFGLPTTLVGERERGVWRRYRLTPVPTWAFVLGTVGARAVLLATAGLLQLGLALGLGMTFPAHPGALVVAFAFTCFAFLGLGLVLAALADTVPAVQALGQCLFLPMLIIGGVAVPLAALPDWAQHVSAFFPGRYAVEAIQAAVNGRGLEASRFSLLALGLTGVAGCLAGAKLFRWDAQQRFRSVPGKGWLIVAFGAWIAVGVLAEVRGRIAVPADAEAPARPTAPASAPGAIPPPVAVTPAAPPAPAATPPPTLPLRPPPPPPVWAKITAADWEALDYRLPPDHGIVAPIAAPDEEPDDFLRAEIDRVRTGLATWSPGVDGDALYCIRNLLYVAAVPDAIQLPAERHLPRVVYQYLLDSYPRGELTQILTYIAQHPLEGPVVDSIAELGIEGAVGDVMLVRERAYFYALKFLGRLTGRLED